MYIDYKEFSRVGWIDNAVLYEVNTRQYTPEGTFNAFSEHLPRLKNMGIDILWFMPITKISTKVMKGTMGSPYACSSYVTINEQLGTLDDFKKLVSVAHALGMKVIIDWVANHTGWEHDWIETHPGFHKRDLHGNVYALEGMDDIIGLNYDNDEMQDAMVQAMKYWVMETGIDGFRCDLADWVRLSFWQKARRALEPVKNMFWLAESDFIDSPDFMSVFDACYTWKWMHASSDFAEGRKTFDEFVHYILQYNQFTQYNKIPLWFTSNHDENSWNGTEYEKYGDMAIMLAAFTFTWNGMPLVYTGQEMPNLKRIKFFDKDNLVWPPKLEMEGFYTILCKLKHDMECLAASKPGTETTLIKAESGLFIFERKSAKDSALCLFNFSKEPQTINGLPNLAFNNYREVFSGETLVLDAAMELEPNGFKIFRSF